MNWYKASQPHVSLHARVGTGPLKSIYEIDRQFSEKAVQDKLVAMVKRLLE